LISEKEAIPIIDSILELGRRHTSLKWIQFPQQWYEDGSKLFLSFKRRYKQFILRGEQCNCGDRAKNYECCYQNARQMQRLVYVIIARNITANIVAT
jgi:hypothetical protein